MSEQDKIKWLVVEVKGKKSIQCPNCGSSVDVPLKTVGMNKLRLEQELKRLLAESKKKHAQLGFSIASTIACLTCPQCGQPILCLDEFTSISEKRE